jgi:predicted  nucleic acid-binding Zn-ribbon protein
MNSECIKDLEKNIKHAVQLIASLRDEKSNLEKENESLRRQVESLRAEVEEQAKALSVKSATPEKRDFDHPEIKVRLEKLVGKLAALEDSWN